MYWRIHAVNNLLILLISKKCFSWFLINHQWHVYVCFNECKIRNFQHILLFSTSIYWSSCFGLSLDKQAIACTDDCKNVKSDTMIYILLRCSCLYTCTVYPKKYAHGFCFAVFCCGYTLTDFPISIRLTSLALWQSNDCPSASKATLMNMDKYFIWIHYERLHNHNKAKHNKTVCIFFGIYCMSHVTEITMLLCYVILGHCYFSYVTSTRTCSFKHWIFL